jgi:hypothetical protein
LLGHFCNKLGSQESENLILRPLANISCGWISRRIRVNNPSYTNTIPYTIHDNYRDNQLDTILPPQQPSTTSLFQLTSSINSNPFSNELGYLYIGKGFDEAFEFLFDSSEPSCDHRLRGVEDEDDHDNHPDPEVLRIARI